MSKCEILDFFTVQCEISKVNLELYKALGYSKLLVVDKPTEAEAIERVEDYIKTKNCIDIKMERNFSCTGTIKFSSEIGKRYYIVGCK